jgi:hypothetical protein
MCVRRGPVSLNQQVSKGHRWQKGTSGNPAGRPVGARQRISEALLADLAEVWADHGKDVLIKLAVSDPGKLAQIAYGLLPRDIFLHVQQTDAPHANELARLRDILNVIEQVCPDGSPDEILNGIEQDLRARFATPIEANGSKAVAILTPIDVKDESDQSDNNDD